MDYASYDFLCFPFVSIMPAPLRVVTFGGIRVPVDCLSLNDLLAQSAPSVKPFVYDLPQAVTYSSSELVFTTSTTTPLSFAVPNYHISYWQRSSSEAAISQSLYVHKQLLKTYNDNVSQLEAYYNYGQTHLEEDVIIKFILECGFLHNEKRVLR